MRLRPIFCGEDGAIRTGWVILIFSAVVGGLLVSVVKYQRSQDIGIGAEAGVLFIATWFTQLMIRRPLAEIIGRLNGRWIVELALGSAAGLAIVLFAALSLIVTGHMKVAFSGSSIDSIRWFFFYGLVAFNEELLFRGLVFRNLQRGLGVWQAQLITAAAFLLAHAANPGAEGISLGLVALSLLEASLLFGLCVLRTNSLAAAVGLHWGLDWCQDGLLGLRVSGLYGTAGIFGSTIDAPTWLGGGTFGLEASAPMCTLLFAVLLLFARNKFQMRTFTWQCQSQRTHQL